MNSLNAFLKVPAVKLRFKKFKMNDDTEAKQIAMELNAAGKLSDYTLLTEMGHDPEVESEANKALRVDITEEQIKAGEMQAEAQGKALIIQAKYQVRAQRAANDERLKIQAELFQEELTQENLGIPEDPLKLVDKYAMEIFYMSPKAQEQYLNELSRRMPITYRLVLDRLNMYQTEMNTIPVIGEQMENPVIAKENSMAEAVGKEAIKQEGPPKRKKINLKKEKIRGQTQGQP